MAQLFTNNGFSTLAAYVAAGDATITVATGEGVKFPSPTGGDYVAITLTQAGTETNWEVVYLTARTGDVLTVTRAQESTTALAWNAGDKVVCRITAGFLNSVGTAEQSANKDASGGYPGLTLFKLNLKNALGTFTNFFTSATTAARTWTMPDKDGTVAMLDDVGAAPTMSSIALPVSGTPTTAETLLDFFDLSWSAGAVSGFALTDNGNGTVSIAAGEAVLRNAASPTAPLTSYSVAAATNVALTDNAVNYLYVDQNGGTPSVVASTSLSDVNCWNKCILYKCARYGTTVRYVDATQQSVDHNRKQRHRYLVTENFRYANGMVIAATGTRNFSLSAGELFFGFVDIVTPAFDMSAADTFTYAYRNGSGGWTRTTGNTQIDNTNYDSGTGTLTALSNGNFGVFWVYELIDTPTTVTVLYGQGNYNTLTLAQAATVPASLPPEIAGLGQVVGRIIIKKAATTFSDIASPFTTAFVSGTAADHAGLTSLAWTSSGHTGTAGYLAGFDGAGAAAAVAAAFPASAITSGTLDIARIPVAALERLVPVTDQVARYALTTATVQLGDTVKQIDTDKMYLVVDEANLGNSAGYQIYTAGAASTAATLATARNIDGVAFNGSADVTVIAPATHAATGKATPADADEFALVDSAASNVLKKLTWANLKVALEAYFDTIYPAFPSTINTQTGTTYTLSLTDRSGIVEMNNGSANVVTIPLNASVAFPVGTTLTIIQYGAGATSATGASGVTVNGTNAGSKATAAQYQGLALYKRATDEWVVVNK